MLYHSVLELHPPQAHLLVSGELDAFSARHLRRDIGDALTGGSTDFTVDVSEVTFVDAAGLGAFVGLHNAAVERGGSLTFVATSRTFRWVCDVAGLLSVFDLAGTRAARLPA